MIKLLKKTAAGLCLFAIVLPVNASRSVHVDGQTEHIIEIVNFKFSPLLLSVKSGDTVTWINRDVVSHNVSNDKRSNWRSPDLRKGGTFSIVLTDDLSYVCSLHIASMKGTIVVVNNTFSKIPILGDTPINDAEGIN